ncbi:MAG: porin family protein [Bacteroidales bacterium]
MTIYFKKYLPKVLPFLLILIQATSSHAQVNRCALNLAEAQDKFMSGQIQEVPRLLIDCINNGFSYEDRIEAYKLLINAYIFDDNIEMAEQYMLEFLDNYPEYVASPDDPVEFVSLFELYDNSPRYSMGFNLGTNITQVDVTEPFGVYNVNEVSKDYKISPGFSFGGHINFFLKEKVEFSLEPMLVFRNIKYEVNPYSYTRTEYKENQTRFDLPVSFLYKFSSGPVSPYLRLGATPSFLIGGSAESSRLYTSTGSLTYDDLSGEADNISEQRTSLNFLAFLGAGLRYELSKSFLFVDVRYNYALNSMVDPESRQNLNDNNTWIFYNTQDDFFLNDVMITFGYTKVFYKTKKVSPY